LLLLKVWTDNFICLDKLRDGRNTVPFLLL